MKFFRQIVLTITGFLAVRSKEQLQTALRRHMVVFRLPRLSKWLSSESA